MNRNISSYLFYTLSLLLILEINSKDIITKIQFGKDESTIQKPLANLEERKVNIVFTDSYSDIPEVLIYITSISIIKSNLQNYKVKPNEITENGFQLVYTSELAGNEIQLKVQWLAFEKGDVAELVYQDINGTRLKDSTIPSDRKDSFVIEFKNEYQEPPNLNVFLLGLSSIETTIDAINLDYSESTRKNCKITVSSYDIGMIDKASFVVFVSKKRVSISQLGIQSNVVSGSVDMKSIWMDTSKTNRIVNSKQQIKETLSESDDSGSHIINISGFRGYDVRSNQLTNIRINLSQFDDKGFEQAVETWDTSQVVSGYWDSIAINSTTKSLASLKSEESFNWWMILVAFIAAIIVIAAIVFLVIYCENKKKRLIKEALEAEKRKAEDLEKQKNSSKIKDNEDEKSLDQSILKSKANQNTTQNNLIKDNLQDTSGIYNENNPTDYNNSKKPVDESFGGNSYYLKNNGFSPKHNNTEQQETQGEYAKQNFMDNLESNPNRQEQFRNNLQKQQSILKNNENQDGKDYYFNPRKKYENVNNISGDNGQDIAGNNGMFYSVQNKLTRSQTGAENMYNSQQLKFRKANSIKVGNNQNKPIDNTIREVEHEINQYQNDDYNLNNMNQSQMQQYMDMEQSEEMKEIKQTNYDVYRQIIQSKYKFDQENNDNSAGLSQNSVQQLDQNNENILNNRQSVPYIPDQNNINSNNSTYRPFQISHRNDDQQSAMNGQSVPQISRSNLSQIGNMIVSGNNQFSRQNSQYSPDITQSKFNTYYKGDSPSKLNKQFSVIQNQRINDEQEDEEDFPQRPDSDNHQSPII